MGTRFRTMLAPLGMSTGDGRRFGADAITLADLPMPFEWVRSREGGHNGAVSIGAVQEAALLSVADAVEQDFIAADRVKGLDPAMMAVWARGTFYDDVDREKMPRLAEDVAEVLHLIGEGTLGPSVDLDSFEGVPVKAGTDDPVTFEDLEAEFEETGQEPKIELLITQGRVRAATLVSIPAFAETSRPLEMVAEDPEQVALAASQNPDLISQWARETLALIASVAAPERTGIEVFDRPALAGPTPITWDYENGRVYGHIATWQTCHSGYADVCVTAPRDTTGGEFTSFHRFPVEVGDGEIVWTGRITAGGRHAGLDLTASATTAHYDAMTVAAHVRAYEDEFGIVIAGAIAPGLDEGTKAVLSRRKVSGDWRATASGLSLLEVLALSPGPRAHSEPGFPVETFSRAGRQVALVASLGPEPETEGVSRGGQVDIDALAAALERRQAARDARAALSAIVVNDEQHRTRTERDSLALLLAGGGGRPDVRV